MKMLILISMVMLSTVTVHAESKKEVRILSNITLNEDNYYDYRLTRFIPNTQGEYCNLILATNAKTSTKVEAGTIFTIDSIKFLDTDVAEVPFVNKVTRSTIRLSSEDKNLNIMIECTSKRFLRRATAQENKIDIEKALTAFTSLLN